MPNNRPVLVASAAGVSGYMSRPQSAVVPTQAAAVTGPMGGFSESKTQAYILPGLLQTAGSLASASGTEAPTGSPILSADASVLATDVLGVVRFDAVRASLRVDLANRQLGASAALHIEGLQVHNRKLLVYISLREHLAYDKLPEPPQRRSPVTIHWMDDAAPGVLINESRITIRDFGILRLGEMLLTCTGWHLTAIQMELGSPVGAVLAFGSVTALYLPGDPIVPPY
jgi:hypothetical protein